MILTGTAVLAVASKMTSITGLISLLIVLLTIRSAQCWDSEEMEIFDLVEEINQNFYELLGVSQVRGIRKLWLPFLIFNLTKTSQRYNCRFDLES